MQSRLLAKLKSLYSWYVLGVLSVGYILGEIGHYLIGTTAKVTAEDLHYGDITCQLNLPHNLSHLSYADLPIYCDTANDTQVCESYTLNGTRYCEWNYNGLGLDYQVLAGPAYFAVFTVAGVIIGVIADKFNRVKTLTICTAIFTVAIILMGAVKEYWHLVVLRMVLAVGEAGCNPLATGILSDLFPEHQRALVLSIFNWGIYGGYGISFPIGRYISELNAWGLRWRISYYGAGILCVIITIMTAFTIKDPPRTEIGEDNQQGEDVEGSKKREPDSVWKVLMQPRIILLCLAASIRHCGGMTFALNSDLYYREYFPDTDLSWWLFIVTVGIGSIGVVAGGVISDRFVSKMGIRSRALILGLSQLIATLPSFGSVIFNPLWAMITLAIAYFFAEMWFGIVFAILVEIVPLKMRSTIVGVFLFVMNNVGGNLPTAVEPVSKAIGYREALCIFYAGFYLISSVMFLITMFFLEGAPKEQPPSVPVNGHGKSEQQGVDNRAFTGDHPIPLGLSGISSKQNGMDSHLTSRL